MIILLQTNNLVLLNFVKFKLKENNIEHFIFDEQMNITEGCITAISARVMVHDYDYKIAKKIIDI